MNVMSHDICPTRAEDGSSPWGGGGKTRWYTDSPAPGSQFTEDWEPTVYSKRTDFIKLGGVWFLGTKWINGSQRYFTVKKIRYKSLYMNQTFANEFRLPERKKQTLKTTPWTIWIMFLNMKKQSQATSYVKVLILNRIRISSISCTMKATWYGLRLNYRQIIVK